MFVSQLQESVLTMSVTITNSTEFSRFYDPIQTEADASVLVKIEAVAEPDTLSRLLEPLVVLQVTPKSVECSIVGGGMMKVCIDLADDHKTAERFVRKLDGAVVVSRMEIVSQADVFMRSGIVDTETRDAPELQMVNT